LLRKIDDQRDTSPLFLLLRHAQEETPQQRPQVDEIARRALLVIVGVLDVIIDLEPLKKTLLHFAASEGQAVADVVKQQAGALRKKAAHQKGLERHIADR